MFKLCSAAYLTFPCIQKRILKFTTVRFSYFQIFSWRRTGQWRQRPRERWRWKWWSWQSWGLFGRNTSAQQQSQMEQFKLKIEERARVLLQNSPQQLVPQFVNSKHKPSAVVHSVQPVAAAGTQVYRCDQDGCGKICKSLGRLTLHKKKMHSGLPRGLLCEEDVAKQKRSFMFPKTGLPWLKFLKAVLSWCIRHLSQSRSSPRFVKTFRPLSNRRSIDFCWATMRSRSSELENNVIIYWPMSGFCALSVGLSFYLGVVCCLTWRVLDALQSNKDELFPLYLRIGNFAKWWVLCCLFWLILGVKTYHLHEWRRTKKTKKTKQKIERTQ